VFQQSWLLVQEHGRRLTATGKQSVTGEDQLQLKQSKLTARLAPITLDLMLVTLMDAEF
jgi:hypothetical protein